MLEKYENCLLSGTVNGYGYIDCLSDGQIEILCGIASAVSKKTVSGRDALKNFTRQAERKIFDRYIENVMLAHGELVSAAA